jgi:hypothetical protein
MMADKSPAVEVAKKVGGEHNLFELTDGTRVRVTPVSAALIDEVSSRIKDPPIPMYRNEEKGRDEPNPVDPKYLEGVQEAQNKRGTAAIDAMVMFGIELVDGLPEDEGWLGKLKWLEKRGSVDLSEYDMNDPVEKEFVYKRFVACAGEILEAITRVSGISGEDIARAEASFRGAEGRSTD